MDKLVHYSLNFVDGALPWLRFRGPAHYLGWQAEAGNEWTEVSPEKAAAADVVVVQRDFPRLEADFARILQWTADKGIPVILDLDDLLLDLPTEHPDRQENYYASALLPVWRALYQVDLVTVSTPLMAEVLRPWQPKLEVLPNLLDEQVWPEMEQLSAENRLGESGDLQVNIGYWGGSSHASDLGSVASALVSTLERCPGVRLHVWGPVLPAKLQDHPHVTRCPLEIYRYSEYADFLRQQAKEKQIDLVIAPLRDNLFNRCKSGIKHLEYSAMGLPGVYSRMEPYSSLVQDGVNGFLADTLQEWGTALIRLVEDAGLRQRMGRQAQAFARHDHSMAAHANRWQQVYAGAAEAARQRAKAGAELAGTPPAGLLFRLAEQLHQAYQNGKRSVLDGPADTNPAARLWQVEKELHAAQDKLAEIERSRGWKLVQWWWRLRGGKA